MSFAETNKIDDINNYIKKIASYNHPLPQAGRGGTNRLAFTPAETKVLNWAKEELESFGYYCEYDSFLNLHAYDQRNNKPRILVGTHLDTVLNGGDYDGTVGFVTFLISLQQTREKEKQFKYPVDFVVFRAEESTIFKEAVLGSKVATGRYNLEELRKKIYDRPDEIDPVYEKLYENDPSLKRKSEWNPIDLIYANSNSNVKLSDIKQGCWFFRDREGKRLDYEAYFEVHIEQGKVLEKKNIKIGIVSSIRAPVRCKVMLKGKRDHSGATPMGKEFRKDVLCAASECILEIEKICEDESINKKVDIVGTVGSINVPGMGINIIPGECSFTIDLRSNNLVERDRIYENICDKLKFICQERDIKITFDITERSYPVSLRKNASSEFFEKIKNTIDTLGLTYLEMPSGAGHDAMIISQSGIPSCLLFIPCKDGISHSPEEFASPEDIFNASQILEKILLEGNVISDGLDG